MEKMYPEKRGEREVKRMTKDLGLNESQQKEMKALFSEVASKRGEGDTRPSKEDRKAMKNKISKDFVFIYLVFYLTKVGTNNFIYENQKKQILSIKIYLIQKFYPSLIFIPTLQNVEFKYERKRILSN